MAGFTYSGLKTGVQNYLDNTETTFVNTINTFIETAEERILKSVQLPVFRKNVTGSASANVEYLQTPADFLSPFSLALIDSSMLYGSLVEGAVFMKSSPDTIMLYEQKFQEALAMLKLLGEYKDVRDEARNDQIKIMPSGTTNV